MPRFAPENAMRDKACVGPEAATISRRGNQSSKEPITTLGQRSDVLPVLRI
jgi:hypothetical protein